MLFVVIGLEGEVMVEDYVIGCFDGFCFIVDVDVWVSDKRLLFVVVEKWLVGECV